MNNKDYLHILGLFTTITKTSLKTLECYKNYTIEFEYIKQLRTF